MLYSKGAAVGPTWPFVVKDVPMRRSFTLVELLVAISIIALLAAIALPVTVRVRGYARKTQCLSNLGQIGKAVNLYANDLENWLPCAAGLPSMEPQPGLPRICDLLKLYASADAFQCPDDLPTDPAYKFRSYFEGEGSSYEWAELLNGKKMGQALRKRWHNLDFVPMAYDYEPFHRRGGGNVGLDVLFADSHVEGL